MTTSFHRGTTQPRPYSTLRVKARVYQLATVHALQDALYAVIPVAIVAASVSFVSWFWGNGPTDLLLSAFGIKLGNVLLAKILATALVSVPSIAFAKASLFIYLKVQGDRRALDRDLDLEWDRIVRLDTDRQSQGGRS